jgi:hypothetical protein
MRRTIGGIAVAALVGAGAGATTTDVAAADPTRTVEFTGTSVFDAASPDCSLIHQVFDATLTSARGDTLHIDGCVEVFTFPFTFTGTFLIDSPGPRDMTGTVSGVIGTDPSVDCGVEWATTGFEFVLEPTDGTGRPATPLQADGTWCSPGVVGVPGPISGTLTGALPPGRD